MRDKVKLGLTFVALSVALSLFAWSSLVNYIRHTGKQPLPVVATLETPQSAEAALLSQESVAPAPTAPQDSNTPAPYSASQQECASSQITARSDSRATQSLSVHCMSDQRKTEGTTHDPEQDGQKHVYSEVKQMVSRIIFSL